MRALKESTLVADLGDIFSKGAEDGHIAQDPRTILPALSSDRRHVEVSVALQLKHWRRM